MQYTRQGPLVEINDRAPQNVPGRVNAQLRPAISVEETQSKLPLMGINTALTKTRDGMSPHQGWDLRRLDVQEFTKQRGIDQNISIGDLDLHDAAFR